MLDPDTSRMDNGTMTEDEYEEELDKYEEAMAEFNAKADKLQATERELVMQSRQDEVRQREWVARYDVALEKQPPDEKEIAAYMAAVKELRNRAIQRKAALDAVRADYDELFR
jgi:hypothetical protein